MNCFWEKSVLRLLILTVKIIWARKRSLVITWPLITSSNWKVSGKPWWPMKVGHCCGCRRFEHWNGQAFDWYFKRSKLRNRLQLKRLLGKYATSFGLYSAIKTTRICTFCSLAPFDFSKILRWFFRVNRLQTGLWKEDLSMLIPLWNFY